MEQRTRYATKYQRTIPWLELADGRALFVMVVKLTDRNKKQRNPGVYKKMSSILADQ